MGSQGAIFAESSFFLIVRLRRSQSEQAVNQQRSPFSFALHFFPLHRSSWFPIPSCKPPGVSRLSSLGMTTEAPTTLAVWSFVSGDRRRNYNNLPKNSKASFLNIPLSRFLTISPVYAVSPPNVAPIGNVTTNSVPCPAVEKHSNDPWWRSTTIE